MKDTESGNVLMVLKKEYQRVRDELRKEHGVLCKKCGQPFLKSEIKNNLCFECAAK